jgi:peroxiredoxin Q/BCP
VRKSILGTLATSAMVALGSIGSKTPAAGDPAPPFEAPSTAGQIRLTDFKGKKHVVLAFYFADFTPG